MPISITCDCGKNLKAPDSAAGRKTSCPDCGAAIDVPEAVYDAEEAMDEQEENFSSDGSEDVDSDSLSDTASSVRRKACPACGEQIVAAAVKCRFCGEVFDEVAAKALDHSTRQKTELTFNEKQKLKKYQASMRGLGAFGIFAVLLCIVVTGVQASGIAPQNAEEKIAMIIVLAMLGMIWVVLATFSFLMKNWAAYAVGALSVLNCIGSLGQANVGGAVFAGAVAWAAFSTAISGRKLIRQGIPLNKKLL